MSTDEPILFDTLIGCLRKLKQSYENLNSPAQQSLLEVIDWIGSDRQRFTSVVTVIEMLIVFEPRFATMFAETLVRSAMRKKKAERKGQI